MLTFRIILLSTLLTTLVWAAPHFKRGDDDNDGKPIPMQYGVTCAPFNYSNSDDQSHWEGVGYIDIGTNKDGQIDMHKDLKVQADPGKSKFDRITGIGIYGSPTHYTYTFRAGGSYIEPLKQGFIYLEAQRSTGKGLGQQFRIFMWNKKKHLLGAWWITPNIDCTTFVDFDPTTAHTIGVDARDWNGPDENEHSQSRD